LGPFTNYGAAPLCLRLYKDVSLEVYTSANHPTYPTMLLTTGNFAFRAVALLPLAFAAWNGNLNYRSPSYRHPSLGIDVPLVAKRSLPMQRRAAYDAADLNFTHGVASGDPFPNSVILWTRIAPSMENDRSNVTVEGAVPLYSHDTETYIKASPNPICVEYRIGIDKELKNVADKGTAYTTSDIDFTVKVELHHSYYII
jgi:alkaline phosphatase D